MRRTLLGVLCSVVFVAGADATPLRMDYTITSVGGSVYRYNFTLTLDNHDASWTPSQQWDWIVFGANDAAGTKQAFDTNGSAAGGLDWTTLAFAAPITTISTSGGFDNGPVLWIDGNGPLLPGWQPSAIGESLVWSGLSFQLIHDGQLYWSSPEAGGGATAVHLDLAHEITAVPEPASLVLLGSGLLTTWVRRRRRK